MPPIFAFAWAMSDWLASSRNAAQVAMAAPAIAALAKKRRRFQYTSGNVISEDLMSGAFLISISHLTIEYGSRDTLDFLRGAKTTLLNGTPTAVKSCTTSISEFKGDDFVRARVICRPKRTWNRCCATDP